MRTFLTSVIAVLFLSACVSYPKPTYRYVGVADDPVFFFESDFGTNTQFLAKTENIKDEPKCLANSERVAYLQDMDSYYRDADAPGPWKITAKAGQPILIAGHWFKYGSSQPLAFNMVRHTPEAFCNPLVKILVPKAGEEYLVRLTNAGNRACSMSITLKDGSPVDATDALECQQSPYSPSRNIVRDIFR